MEIVDILGDDGALDVLSRTLPDPIARVYVDAIDADRQRRQRLRTLQRFGLIRQRGQPSEHSAIPVDSLRRLIRGGLAVGKAAVAIDLTNGERRELESLAARRKGARSFVGRSRRRVLMLGVQDGLLARELLAPATSVSVSSSDQSSILPSR
jgi:hypothetical protein